MDAKVTEPAEGRESDLPAGIGPGVACWSFSNSSGPGGQNVNKRATRAELRIAVADLPLTHAARDRFVKMAGHLVTDSGDVLIASQKHRSQEQNKAACVERLRVLIESARKEPKKRRATKPTRGSKERRISAKKRRGDVKRLRKSEE